MKKILKSGLLVSLLSASLNAGVIGLELEGKFVETTGEYFKGSKYPTTKLNIKSDLGYEDQKKDSVIPRITYITNSGWFFFVGYERMNFKSTVNGLNKDVYYNDIKFNQGTDLSTNLEFDMVEFGLKKNIFAKRPFILNIGLEGLWVSGSNQVSNAFNDTSTSVNFTLPTITAEGLFIADRNQGLEASYSWFDSGSYGYTKSKFGYYYRINNNLTFKAGFLNKTIQGNSEGFGFDFNSEGAYTTIQYSF